MNRKQALSYTTWIIHEQECDTVLKYDDHNKQYLSDDAILIGWDCGFQPLVIAVQSCVIGCEIGHQEAVDLATTFLREKGWFGASGEDEREPDYVIG